MIVFIFYKIIEFFFPEKIRFKGHYTDWSKKRIKCIVDHYGKSFFKGKKLLELGCSYGDIGAVFSKLGAKVTCSDAREEHLKVVNVRYPHLKTVRVDLDNEWPFKKEFDIILHLGTLYHLKNYKQNLRKVCNSTKHLVLETEVCDSDNPDLVIYRERGYDQSFNREGSRPSPVNIERLLKKYSMSFECLSNSNYNSGFHHYNWKIKNTGKWENGLRRLWFAKKVNYNSH